MRNDDDRHVVKLEYWVFEWMSSSDDRYVFKVGIGVSNGRAAMTTAMSEKVDVWACLVDENGFSYVGEKLS